MAGLISTLAKVIILSREAQIDKVQEWQDSKDRKALESLVNSNLRMAKQIANMHNRNGIDNDDLMQSAIEGTIIAANKYKVGSPMAFSTYARKWMIAKCQENIRNNFGTIRVGSRVAKTLYASLPKYRREFTAKQGREPQPREIARHFGFAIGEVEKAMSHMGKYAASLNVPIGDDGDSTLESVIPSSMPTPEANLARKESILQVREIIGDFSNTLNARDNDIFSEYVVNGQSGTVVGTRHGISRQRVSQIGNNLKGKFKARLLANGITR